MKKLIMSVLMMLGLMGGAIHNSYQPIKEVKAEGGEYIHDFAASQVSTTAGAKTFSSIVWQLTSATYVGFDANKGVQIGSSSSPQTTEWTLTTPISSFGNNIRITTIAVNSSTAASPLNPNLKLSVGETTFNHTLDATPTLYSSDFSETSGSVTIGLKTSSKALYIKSISVSYSVIETPITEVSDYTELQTALDNKVGNIELTANITTDQKVNIRDNVIIDGKGHTFTTTGNRAIQIWEDEYANSSLSETYVIKDLNIVLGTGDSRAFSVLLVNSTLTLEDIDIIGTGKYYGLLAYEIGPYHSINSTFNLDNVTTHGTYGSVEITNGENNELNISNSILEGVNNYSSANPGSGEYATTDSFGGNDYAVVAFYSTGEVNILDSTLKPIENSTAHQYKILYFKGAIVKINGVRLPATEISIDVESPLILEIGQEYDIPFTSDGENYLYWTPERNDLDLTQVAWVSSSSIIRAVREGRVTVTATSPSNELLVDTLEVIVRPANQHSIKLNYSVETGVPTETEKTMKGNSTGINYDGSVPSVDVSLSEDFVVTAAKNSATQSTFINSSEIRLYKSAGTKGSSITVVSLGLISTIEVTMSGSLNLTSLGVYSETNKLAFGSGMTSIYTINSHSFTLEHEGVGGTGAANRLDITGVVINYTEVTDVATILPSTGLRFRSEFTLPEGLVASNITQKGYLLVPTNLLGANILDLEYASTHPEVLNVNAVNYVESAGKIAFSAVLTGIPEGQYGRLITAVAYINDGVTTVYSTPSSRSLKTVAQELLGIGGLTSAETLALLKIIGE
jgi:hypothetical protein